MAKLTRQALLQYVTLVLKREDLVLPTPGSEYGILDALTPYLKTEEIEFIKKLPMNVYIDFIETALSESGRFFKRAGNWFVVLPNDVPVQEA